MDMSIRENERPTKGYLVENCRSRDAYRATKLGRNPLAGSRPREVKRALLLPCKTAQGVLGGDYLTDRQSRT